MNQDFLYDAIVIGGGPSGAAFASFARKKGMSVLVLEKEKFPRDHIGESLIPFTYRRLKELGVIDRLRTFATFKPGVNFVDIDGVRESTWCFGKVLKDDSHLTFHMVRSVFDKMLLDRASELGAVVCEEHMVKEVDLKNPEMVNVRAVDANGKNIEVKGRFLVDASGQGSFLAKKLGTKKPYKDLDRTAFYSHWLNTTYDEALIQGLIKIIYLGGQKKGWFWVIPIGRNHLSIGVSVGNAYVREMKAKLEAQGEKDWVTALYMQEVGYAAPLKTILAGANMEHQVCTIGDYSYYSEKKYGANYVMVGDAGAFLDPIFSSGISVALETAARTCNAVHIQLTQGVEKGQAAFEEEYASINGAYELIEKFVRLFYSPDLLNFAHVPQGETVSYHKFLYAYNIFHYLLAGDFFDNHKKYLALIDTIRNENSYQRFLYYIQTMHNERDLNAPCLYSFNEMYGHLHQDRIVEVKG